MFPFLCAKRNVLSFESCLHSLHMYSYRQERKKTYFSWKYVDDCWNYVLKNFFRYISSSSVHWIKILKKYVSFSPICSTTKKNFHHIMMTYQSYCLQCGSLLRQQPETPLGPLFLLWFMYCGKYKMTVKIQAAPHRFCVIAHIEKKKSITLAL